MNKKKQHIESKPVSYKPVAVWILICAFMVLAMAVIGAITRLTESGLSIVEWRPVTGFLPPLSPEEWNRVFDLYKESPQFQKINFDMDLDGFKQIFFWEWFHRLWGRLIGLVYAVPFFIFLLTKRLPKHHMGEFIVLLVLGACQGLMGWVMVQSGLVDHPEVSHYRLAAHLSLAALIFVLMIRLAVKILCDRSDQSASMASLSPHALLCVFTVFITLIYGAFVAGLDAGRIWNEFPLMGKYPWPAEGLDMNPFWINFFENHAMVQFIHRCLGITSFILILGLVFRSHYYYPEKRIRIAFGLAGLMVILQLGLGIATLLSGVHIHIAATHQAGAFILLGLLVWISQEIPPKNMLYIKKTD